MEPPDCAEASSNVSRSEQVSTPSEAMQQDRPDDELKPESEPAGSQQDDVPEPMQHDTPDKESKHESEALKNEKSHLSDGTGSEQVNPSEAVEHHVTDGSKTAGSQQDNVPEPMQLDAPDKEVKHESEASKNKTSILSDGTGSEQVNLSEAVEHHVTDTTCVHGSKTGDQQANLPEPKQRDMPDDELKRENKAEKRVSFVRPYGTDRDQVNPPEGVEHGKLYKEVQQGSKTGAHAAMHSKGKRYANVVTLKDLDAEPWYNNSQGQYKKALQEGRSAANMPWTKVALWKGDITKLEVDAIVNAANSRLLGGGGVDGAIHAAAGPKLKEECRGLKGCAPGDAKITKGYNLPAKHVIHTVGPMDGDPEVLKSSYRRCFQLMTDHQLKSVAFPCIATGIYGFPNDDAADIALSTAREWLEKHHAHVEKIVFCVFLPMDFELYNERLPVYFSPEDAWKGGSSIGREEAKSDPFVAKEDVGSEAGSRQLAEVQPVGESAGSEQIDDDAMPRDREAAAVTIGNDASSVPANSAAAKPADTDEVASSLAETAVDVSDQPTSNDRCGCGV